MLIISERFLKFLSEISNEKDMKRMNENRNDPLKGFIGEGK